MTEEARTQSLNEMSEAVRSLTNSFKSNGGSSENWKIAEKDQASEAAKTHAESLKFFMNVEKDLKKDLASERELKNTKNEIEALRKRLSWVQSEIEKIMERTKEEK